MYFLKLIIQIIWNRSLVHQYHMHWFVRLHFRYYCRNYPIAVLIGRTYI